MHAFDPYRYVSLEGDGITRGVTLSLPTSTVRALLPAGLELGRQDLTEEPDTHPVVLLFHEIFRAKMSIPSLLPDLTYHEHSVGIPFSYLTRSARGGPAAGPYYFMPSVLLDDALAVLGGVLYWGFVKRMAEVRARGNDFTVAESGRPLVSLDSRPVGEFLPLSRFPSFEIIRSVLDQPVISSVPFGVGPFFASSHFEKRWQQADVRPLEASLEIFEAYVPGLPIGRLDVNALHHGIDRHVLGSYEYRAPWRLTWPYPVLARW